jgi:gluconokinase
MNSALDEVVDEVEPAPNFASVMAGTKPSLLLSIDVGTSGVRAALIDDNGNELPGAQARSPHGAKTSDFGELDADALVDEVIRTIDKLLTYHFHSVAQIDLIAISTFWHSLIGIDAKGLPTTPLLTWADTRGARFAQELRARFDEREIHARTGCRFHSSYWPAKLQWLKFEQSESFRNTRCWLGFAEYLCSLLFGDNATSVSMASATGLVNQQGCEWDWSFVEDLELSPDTLPVIKSSTSLQLLDSFASRWPALAEARLVTITGDGAANNIGAGCSTKERIALMIGTSGAMRVAFAGDPPTELPPALWSYRVSNNRVVVGGALSDGGGLIQWLMDSCNVNSDKSVLEAEIGAIEPDSHGLTVLPFWFGERSPGWLAGAHGGVFGLRPETRPVEIVRAALESIAYRFALIARDLEKIAPGAKLFASGNALRSSPVWLQIIADVLGRPLMFGGTAEASIRGAALLALEAVGKIATLEEGSFSVEQVFAPDMTRHARYQDGLARQQELYERVYKAS